MKPTVKKILSEKLVLVKPMRAKRVRPHTILPASKEMSKFANINIFFLGKTLYKRPVIKPYTAISIHINSQLGKAGIPNNRALNGAAIIPTASPYGQPHKNPQRRTGRCIGESILPIFGICPVKNGKIRQRAKQAAA